MAVVNALASIVLVIWNAEQSGGSQNVLNERYLLLRWMFIKMNGLNGNTLQTEYASVGSKGVLVKTALGHYLSDLPS